MTWIKIEDPKTNRLAYIRKDTITAVTDNDDKSSCILTIKGYPTQPVNISAEDFMRSNGWLE